MARSLNKVQLIGNLTRDPELRYTPSGAAVCTFGLATGRSWTTESGEKKEDTEFHRIVAWNKLAELCSQFLTKGRKAYVEGRLSTRNWTGQDGNQRTTTEVVIDNMIILDPRRQGEEVKERTKDKEETDEKKGTKKPSSAKASEGKEKKEEEKKEELPEEEVAPDDIPF
ncbi:single-stranded DNA-binding protein [Patescibacteria group bacterium]|nr:single-stranded DNA-binding protein [Patescibacteria group bacterium]